MSREEIIAKIRANGVYDFISNHYWELKREDFRDITKELYYNYICGTREERRDFETEDFIEKLNDLWEM